MRMSQNRDTWIPVDELMRVSTTYGIPGILARLPNAQEVYEPAQGRGKAGTGSGRVDPATVQQLINEGTIKIRHAAHRGHAMADPGMADLVGDPNKFLADHHLTLPLSATVNGHPTSGGVRDEVA